jgi:asparagine synthase (glutamine-hydrolysing)
MLHLDVWWRGQNVLADGGSYLYNGPARWHDHFLRTASHNTVTVDGRDQMLHFRRFKTLYWTEAALTRFEDAEGHALAAGHHLGYRRHPGGGVHRREILFVKDDLWVVVDTVTGEGEHAARLHWLAGDYPHAFDAAAARLTLDTPRGPFCVTVLDEAGQPLDADVVAGGEAPPRGWLARYYGEKRPVASLAVVRRGAAPLRFVSLLSAGPAAVKVVADHWTITAAGRETSLRLEDGRLAFPAA